MIEETDILTQRMELAKGRMQEIVETESDFELLPYFKKQFSFCLFLFDLYEKFWLLWESRHLMLSICFISRSF